MSHSLGSVWGHSVHLAEFLMLRFQKANCSHSFHSVPTNLYDFALCNISEVKIFKRLLFQQFSFHFNQTLLYYKYVVLVWENIGYSKY